MILRTARLILRPVKFDDRDRVFAISTHPAVRGHLLPGQATEAGVRHWVEMSANHGRMATGVYFAFMIVAADEAAEQTVGLCTLTLLGRRMRTGSIGWEMDPSFSGKGFATEAASALLDLGFGACRLRTIQSDCYRENEGSRRVMQKLGMAEVTSWPTRLHMWWSYPDTRGKCRYSISKYTWLYQRQEEQEAAKRPSISPSS